MAISTLAILHHKYYILEQNCILCMVLGDLWSKYTHTHPATSLSNNILITHTGIAIVV